MDNETKLLVDWIVKSLAQIRDSHCNGQIVLNCTAGGTVHYELKTTGQLVDTKKARYVALEERHRTP
jgi:hypothetical protein